MLTAAHCLFADDKYGAPTREINKYTTVYSGSIDMQDLDATHARNATEIMIHPEYLPIYPDQTETNMGAGISSNIPQFLENFLTIIFVWN